jgi:hypothetical protein
MTSKYDHVDTITIRRLAACRELLTKKRLEYAPPDGEYADPLRNFSRAAALLKCSPPKALMAMASKHLVSIMDMVDDYDSGKRLPDPDRLGEKISDAICYLLLLEAMLTPEGSIPLRPDGDAVNAESAPEETGEDKGEEHAPDADSSDDEKQDDYYGPVTIDELEWAYPPLAQRFK